MPWIHGALGSYRVLGSGGLGGRNRVTVKQRMKRNCSLLYIQCFSLVALESNLNNCTNLIRTTLHLATSLDATNTVNVCSDPDGPKACDPKAFDPICM